MVYVDGFVLPIPRKNIPAYKRIARLAAKVWKEHGALEYRECAGDDLQTKFGVPFEKLAGAKRSETVILAWIVYKSKAERNRVNKKVMQDPRMTAMCGKKMPFDMHKMSMGGFKVIVEA